MLEQKQRVRLFTRQNRSLGSLLKFKRRAVFDQAASFNFQNSLSHLVRTTWSSG
jgi:hypothetical protein